MLHKPPQHAGSYQQSEQLAQDLGGGKVLVNRFPGAAQPPSLPPSQPPVQPPQQQPRQPPEQQQLQQPQAPPRQAPAAAARPPQQQQVPPQQAPQQPPQASKGWQQQKGTWGKEASTGEWPPRRGKGQDTTAFMNEYSTPLDVSSIPLEKRREAERIAKEIEAPPGVPQPVVAPKGGWQQDGRRPGKGGGFRQGGAGFGGYGRQGGAYAGRWEDRKGGGGGGYGGDYGGEGGGSGPGSSFGGGKGDSKGDGKGKGKGRGRREDGASAVQRDSVWVWG
mmetsp:Transcript_114199/g.317688  ORF Transcript_114199/g.317688 Transcript_114199/m.317688 type:complete len:277 (-) Transcript_114199:123-953(-)